MKPRMRRGGLDAQPTLEFLGAAGTVTGSKHLVRCHGRQVLLDCGLFQGLKALRLRNWQAPSFAAAEIDAVVLSHAHVDHSAYLPLLVRNGFHGPVFCTPGTADLLRVLLLDAAHLQEEEAEFANRHGYSKHKPAMPLYTTLDAERALTMLAAQPYAKCFPVTEGVSATFRPAGHILGASSVDLAIGGSAPIRLVYSGDLGRWGRPILHDPELVAHADVLLVESTYGDRDHSPDAEEELAALIRQTIDERRVLLIPAFAVGRTQELLWRIRQLEDSNRIPAVPVFVDSPMAINVTQIYGRHPEDHDLDMKLLTNGDRSPLATRFSQFLRTPQESKSLNERAGPMIVISASGMATGGRVLHHLKQRLPDDRTTVLLPGFQAAGTRGRALQEGAHEVRIHGQSVPVRARIAVLDGLSAHADRSDLLRWLKGFQEPPRQTYVVHGEAHAADQLAATLRSTLGWNARVAEDREIVELAPS